MHEVSIARALVDLACDQARIAGLLTVTRLNCRIGVLRQVENDMLEDAFHAARVGTRCESAALAIESVPLLGECPSCRRRVAIVDWNWECPDCGAACEALSGGDELELVSIAGRTGAVQPTV